MEGSDLLIDIEEMVNSTPNDLELGAKLRALINKIKGI